MTKFVNAMIRQAMDSDRDAVLHLWKTAFHDDEAYISSFLSQYPRYLCLVYETEQKIASMLFLIPCSLAGRAGYYVYACATLPEYQGNGFMRRLLEFSYQKAQQEKRFGLILIPGNDALFDFYKTYHYQLFSGLSESVFSAKGGAFFHFSETDGAALVHQLRNEYFDAETSVFFDENHLQYIVDRLKNDGGAALVFTQNEKKGYALCVEDARSKEALVIEWVLLSDDFQKDTVLFFEGICRYFDKPQIAVRSRAGLRVGAERPFSMIRPCLGVLLPDYQWSYFNLGMDI